MCMKCSTCFARCEVASQRRESHLDVCISERQGTWYTYDAVTDEPGNKFNTTTDTFKIVFHHVSHHHLQLLPASSCSVPMHCNYTYTMMMTSSHSRTGEYIQHIPLLSQHIYHLRWYICWLRSGVYFELMRCCMPESSCVRLHGIYSCLSSCLASFMNTQSQWHSSAILLVESTLMGHFWLLCSFHSSVMMWTHEQFTQ